MSLNYYEVLELSPDVLDWHLVEKALESKKKEWNKRRTATLGPSATQAEQYLKEYPVMHEALRDETTRRQHAAAARNRQAERKRAERERAETLLEELLQVVQGRQTVTSAEVAKLVARTELPRDEVLSALERRRIRVEDPKSRQTRKLSEWPKLDGAIEHQIWTQLEILGLKSLYNFLNDASPETPSERLVEIADGIREEERRRGKHDGVTTAKQALAGKARWVFEDPDRRICYNNSLTLGLLKQFNEHLDFAATRAHRIDVGARESVIAQATNLGVSRDLALQYIESYALEHGWVVEQGDANTRSCGFCKAPNQGHAQLCCGSCGEALQQPCLRCQAPWWTENACCGACGFARDAMLRVRTWVADGQQALEAGKLEKARKLLGLALKSCPNLESARAALRAVEAADEQGRGHQRAQATQLSKLQALVDRRLLVEAEAVLLALDQSLDHQKLAALRSQVQGQMAKARSLQALGDQLRASEKPEQAASHYYEVLGIAADFIAASEALQATPPSPPSGFASDGSGPRLRLQWTALQSQGHVKYVLRRKQGAPPENATDGTLVATLAAHELAFEDSDAAPGVPWFYALFSRRDRVASATGAKLGPILRTEQVREVRVLVQRRSQVLLTWNCPAGAVAVEARRAEGSPPLNWDDAVEVEATKDQLVDRGLRPSGTYTYFLMACYLDPGGGSSVVRSLGVPVTASLRKNAPGPGQTGALWSWLANDRRLWWGAAAIVLCGLLAVWHSSRETTEDPPPEDSGQEQDDALSKAEEENQRLRQLQRHLEDERAAERRKQEEEKQRLSNLAQQEAERAAQAERDREALAHKNEELRKLPGTGSPHGATGTEPPGPAQPRRPLKNRPGSPPATKPSEAACDEICINRCGRDSACLIACECG